ncbi:4,5-DOPA dioxygenase extradiol-like protein [Taphrina deformans PYCC 5710]|uniref:4,5-DOPA dioxygenase extradiol-like protein n=1 Tax=Taphrina deformans (strain PYCC 5710 / ATCC 11124 / CBS 356.35 / IMI 108563 / JCM 9778 / NBRC 8474) TaxID=1097556 RepID=R4X8N3_TAPDE|nr:4,5-DOPA dioxygenase extradiol-like protein [Taphrina deformans PYCC 5710]|eukprot:CCG81994.1 4,5-DOPA dioxygenase extradiol-like protein [Taphrina deformans PYCC 5710]
MVTPSTKIDATAGLSQLPAFKSGSRIPSFFFAHGTPALMKESGRSISPDFPGAHDGPHADFLRAFGPYLLRTYAPKAIVVISAHWETEKGDPIQIAQNTEAWQTENLYYDYYGFADAMYNLKFASRGDAGIAGRVKELLDGSGIPNETLINKRGLDHGCFIPFKLMFGDACPVPIVEVSQYTDLEENFRLGESLAQLSREGVLVLAGGLTIHTFRDFAAFSPSTAKDGYKDFEAHLKRAVVLEPGSARLAGIREATKHEYYRLAHPAIEHFTPIAVAAGAGMDGGARVLSDLHGTISVAFGV